MSLKEQQEYVISAFPNIGMNLAIDLLKHFGSVKNVLTASVDELQKVSNVGEKKAQGIKDVSEKEYKD